MCFQRIVWQNAIPLPATVEETHTRYSLSCISQCFVEKQNVRGSFVHWLHPTVHSSSYRICTVNSGCPDEHTSLVHQAAAYEHKCDLPTLFHVAHSGDELHSKAATSGNG